jgi:hypothetical protein
MNANSTRVMPKSRWKGAICAALLVALSFQAADAAPRASDQPSPAQPSQGNAARDIAITQVQPGTEGFELSASLDGASTITRNVAWRVRNDEGAVIFDDNVPLAVLSAQPGEYVVEARYGTVSVRQPVTLLPGNQLRMNVILNAGGLRILPRLKGLGLVQTRSQSRVYARSASDRGKLIAVSELPGEILRLAVGEYRIESKFTEGNALAVTDVTVKAGLMSSVEIDHVAGAVTLSMDGAHAADAVWRVNDSRGKEIVQMQGKALALVLKPGTYSASAETSGEMMTAAFEIRAGEARQISLRK